MRLDRTTDPPRCTDVGEEHEWESVELRKQRAAGALRARGDERHEWCRRCHSQRIVRVDVEQERAAAYDRLHGALRKGDYAVEPAPDYRRQFAERAQREAGDASRRRQA